MNRIHASGTPAGVDHATPMVGDSEALERVRTLLHRFAGCDAPVLIEGETGTGKELAAREIHYASARRLGPFVPLNCGALPESLLESELFGHRRGAFTDARCDEQGLVEYARGGTLFLDEVDSLPPRAQTTLLRFLQSGEFRAVGERALRKADVRILAATNVSLAAAAESGAFRRDLLYRLNALQVCMPPLRQRGRDIVLLAAVLLEKAVARLELPPKHWSAEALETLSRYPWPGNVREMENVILRACMCGDAVVIGQAELLLAEPAFGRTAVALAPPAPSADALSRVETPDGHAPERETADSAGDRAAIEAQDADGGATDGRSAYAEAKQREIVAFERRYLIELMRRAGGNVSRASALSGTERRHLGKLLKRHGIRHDRRSPP